MRRYKSKSLLYVDFSISVNELLYKTIQNEICSYHNKCYRTDEILYQCITFDYFKIFFFVEFYIWCLIVC